MHPLFIDIHTHHSQSDGLALRSVRLGMETIPPAGSFFSAGIHPWDADKATAQWMQQLKKLSLAAIGEIGLDFAAPVDHTRQQHLFLEQAELAQQRGIPMIIHCVKAYNEILPLLSPYSTPVIFHGFTGSEQLAARIIQTGAYLSFGESLTHSPKTAQAFRRAPIDRLFLETDESTLSIEKIYETAASIRQMPLEELKIAIHTNEQKLFAK